MLNKLSFRLNYSEVEERLDPIFYFKKSNLDIVNKTTLPIYKLKEVINMQRGRFGHRPRNDPSFYDGDYPFIQTGDVVRANFGSSISYSQTLNEKGLKTSRLFSEPVVVLTIAANIGYTAILNYPACFPDSLIGLTSKNDLLELEYINIYISLIRHYIEDLAPQAAQKNINYQQLASIPIVVPAKDVQRGIIDLWNKAQDLKRVKIQQAKERLASIDAYFLEKLDINLVVTTSSLHERVFIVDSNKTLGKRLDPNFYKNFYQGIIESIQRFPNQKLSKLISFSNETWDQKNGFNNSFPYIEISEIDIQTGVIRNVLNVLIENAPSRAKMVVRNGDILVSLTRPNRGAIALYTDKLSIASTGFAILRNLLQENERKILSEYLWYVLRSKICLLQMEQRSTGGNYPAITQEELGNILIPLPSIDEQNQIIAYIRQLREEASKLEDEANLVLENAKREIEKMILGDVV